MEILYHGNFSYNRKDQGVAKIEELALLEQTELFYVYETAGGYGARAVRKDDKNYSTDKEVVKQALLDADKKSVEWNRKRLEQSITRATLNTDVISTL